MSPVPEIADTAADLRSVTNDIERGGQFVDEEVWCCEPIPAPPIVDCADLRVGLGCGPNLQAHRR